jgi:DNA-binding GntR family transcriptional regulator
MKKVASSEIVYDQLFDRIVKGEIPSESKLREVSLAKEFGMSRTPVRDALRQLANDGLVTIKPSLGARVIGFSADDIEDIYDIRMALELLAIDLNGQSLRLKPLTELRDRFQKAINKKNQEEHMQVDALLHRYIVESTGRRYLLHVYDEIGRLMHSFRHLAFRDKNVLKHVIEEHTALIDALLVRDIDKAKSILGQHIRNSKLYAITLINKK